MRSTTVKPRLRRRTTPLAAAAAFAVAGAMITAGSASAGAPPARVSTATAAALLARSLDAQSATAPAGAAAAAALFERGLSARQLAAPAIASAATLFEEDLDAYSIKVTTTTGVKLDLDINADSVPSFSSIDSTQIELGTSTESELHDWGFTTPGATTVSGSSGTVTTGSLAGSFGDLTATFSADGSPTKVLNCNATNYTESQPVKVSGKLFFVTKSTGSHAWGDLGSAGSPRAFSGTGLLDSTYDDYTHPCSPVIPDNNCSDQVNWDAGTSGVSSIDFTGGDGKILPGVLVDRSVNLGSNILRVDQVYATHEPDPGLSVSGSTATLKVTTSGSLVHGSATLKSTKAPTTDKFKCGTGKTAATVTETLWKASVHPGSPTLSAKEQVFGTITLPATKVTGDIYRLT